MRKIAFMYAFVLSAFVLITAQQVVRAQEGAAGSAPRTWTTRAGGYTTKATLLKFEDGVVQLQKQDGNVVSVAIEKLSEADQEFIKQRVPSASGGGNPFSGSGGKHGPMSDVERASATLCEQIDKSYRGKGGATKPRIAVVEFSDLSGKVTDLGRVLSEELITKLFSTGKYNVVERFLLNKAIAEHKLRLQGIVDPNSAKELGKILGVEAIVSGTISDLGDAMRVNARIISTETGEILSVAAVNMPKETATTRPREKSTSASEPTEKETGRLVFHEDFSSYEDGGLPDWGDHIGIQVGQDGRKWLVALEDGMHRAGKKVNFPEDSWFLQFDFTARVRKEPGGLFNMKGLVTSSISLVDEQGRKYRVGWTIDVRKHVFILPDGTTQEFGSGMTMPADGDNRRDATYWLRGRTIRIAKNADVLRLFVDGKAVLSGDMKEFGRFARLEVDVYDHWPQRSYARAKLSVIGIDSHEYLYLTNFKVGHLASPP